MIKNVLLKKLPILGTVLLSIILLSGCSDDSSGSDAISSKVDGDIQRVTSKVTSNGYEAIKVQKGIPVEWTIQVGDGVLTSCNNQIIIEDLNIQKKLAVGDNVIEFTPSKSGTIPYSCWMGMVKSDIYVEEK